MSNELPVFRGSRVFDQGDACYQWATGNAAASPRLAVRPDWKCHESWARRAASGRRSGELAVPIGSTSTLPLPKNRAESSRPAASAQESNTSVPLWTQQGTQQQQRIFALPAVVAFVAGHRLHRTVYTTTQVFNRRVIGRSSCIIIATNYRDKVDERSAWASRVYRENYCELREKIESINSRWASDFRP